MIEPLAQGMSFVIGDDDFLCPNLYVIKGSVSSLLIDTTNRLDHLQEGLREAGAFAKISRQNFVVLTHFHNDHIALVKSLPPSAIVLCSKNTSRYLTPSFSNERRIITEDTQIDLGTLMVSVLPVPSLHSKGSLDVLVGDFLFTGDSLLARSRGEEAYYNHEVAVEMEKRYESIPFSIAIQSHPSALRITKEKLLVLLHSLVVEGPQKEDFLK